MAHKQLATYLNNHLAASTTVLELLTHLASAHAQSDLGNFFTTLHAEILAERQQVETLMQLLAISENSVRQAGAWLTEKMTQLKLRLDSPSDEALRLLEALELIATGLAGKRSLWQCLGVAAQTLPELQGVNYATLVQHSEEQQQRVETWRLQVAKAALV